MQKVSITLERAKGFKDLTRFVVGEIVYCNTDHLGNPIGIIRGEDEDEIWWVTEMEEDDPKELAKEFFDQFENWCIGSSKNSSTLSWWEGEGGYLKYRLFSITGGDMLAFRGGVTAKIYEYETRGSEEPQLVMRLRE